MILKSERTKGDVTPETMLPKASTDFYLGYWLQPGANQAEPLAPTSRVLGLCQNTITSAIVGATEYANPTKELHFDMPKVSTDRFLMPVTNGTATASMVGSTFDIFTDFYGLNVAAGATQFRITRFISATLVEVEVNPLLVA